MASVVQTNFRIRKDLGKVNQVIEIPNLIDIQKKSYDEFLQANIPPDKRRDVGLQAVFKSVFPIADFNGTSELLFVSYNLEKPKYDVAECRQRGMTYAAPIKVTTQLMIYDIQEGDKQSGKERERFVRDIKEQEVYFGELPLMTETGTFIINGTERVVVSQLHRSPGVFFDHDRGKTHSSGKKLFSARVIPYRGSWLDFEFDPKDIIYVRIDRRRKMHATVLLRALGYSTQELLNYFYDTESVQVDADGHFYKELNWDLLLGQRSTRDIRVGEKVVVKKNGKFNKANIKRLRNAGVDRLLLDPEEFLTKVAAHDVINMETGEVILECNDSIADAKMPDPDDPQKTVRLGDLCSGTAKKPATPEKIAEAFAHFHAYLTSAAVSDFKILFIDGINVGSYLRDTLNADKMRTTEDSIVEIYRRLRPGDPPTADTAKNLFNNLFFNPERYDLSTVGRLKLNYKFYSDRPAEEQPPLDKTILSEEDILLTVKHLIEIKNRNGSIDDIDHLGNRRVRAVGELMENQYRIGLVRMERAIKERMNMSQEIDTLMPHDLINAKPVNAVVKEYFGSSQLSQFMDQTNPLSEVTHKRRLSALGPGGLTRERAGFEVRDVHATHYGRICPIETPEGPNIGLIASLSTFAKVNEFGFVESPYRKVHEGVVTDEVVSLSALEEENKYIAQATADVVDGRLIGPLVSARYNGDFKMVPPENIDYMDVAPNQMVSVAAALVPFLEHDDANRALMGANMQRQAVPLLRTDAPLVGTGIEKRLAMDSGVCQVARRDGVVQSVDASRIVVKARGADGDYADIYHLQKYHRSNQSTCYNQKPVVRTGDKVKAGDVLADGPAVDMGELALGRNVLVAFMPWEGYNFEDAILISERVVKEDIFTSVHIEEFESLARDTKLGKEEITRDIPNVGEEALKDLDESGIVRIGAEIHQGDILVGKITPKGEQQLSPEEKLLRAIFGEKAGDVRDSSLRVPPGVTGTVIGARVFSRRGTEPNERAKEIEDQERARLERTRDEEAHILRESAYGRVRRILVGSVTSDKLVDENKAVLIEAGATITEELLNGIPRKYWRDIITEHTDKVRAEIDELEEILQARDQQFEERIERLSRGDELPPGVIRMVKVYVAIKRKLQIGDKMAGRHGNKGVVSRILPEEDLPFLEDGRPVDIVLNPLGVPSRMNVGQILETHLGWGARVLGEQLQQMIENNFSAAKIRERLLQIYEGRNTQYTDLIKSLDDDDVIDFAKKLKRGVFFATPVFDGASETEIKRALTLAGLPDRGQTVLFDGRTGEAFDNDVTVGVMYVLKLHHLVDDKIHARSIGPYSLVTQQPLGGKAQFGGQRLGEMEVWAMEAYGAAYALQEFLTVKSDDVNGRTRMYESIVKGDFQLESGLPESFNVLIKELQSLCLNVELVETGPERSISGRTAAE